MSQMSPLAWYLLLPFLAILAFEVYALWNFSEELRRGRRRRIRNNVYGHRINIYPPPRPVLRFRRDREDEAA